MSAPDCCNRTTGNSEDYENDTLNTFCEEKDQSVNYDGDSEVPKQKNCSRKDSITQSADDLDRSLEEYLESLQVEEKESSRGGSLTTNTVSESVIRASLAEMTAQEMKEIIDWYKNNTINASENRKTLPQRQCLVHNSLAQLNLRDDDEDADDGSEDTTKILEESSLSVEISIGELSSRTSTTTPKRAAQKLRSGAQEALTQTKQVNELCSYTEYMAQVIQSLSSPEACEETDKSPDPLKESARIMSELTGRSRLSESSATQNLTGEVNLQSQEIQHLTNKTIIMAGMTAELEQTSDSDDESYTATGTQPQKLSSAKSKIYASSRRQIIQRRNGLALVTSSMALLVLFLLVSWRTPVTPTPRTTEENRIDQEPSQRIEDSTESECSPRGCDYLPWSDSGFCFK
jgi:hypothetical protein